MKTVSNRDYSDIVQFLREFSATEGDGSTRQYNARRRAGLLARKLERSLERQACKTT